MSPGDSKSVHATTRDLELGTRNDDGSDQITPSGSSSLTPDEARSKAATPTSRRSMHIDDTDTTARHHNTFHKPRIVARLQDKMPPPAKKCARKVQTWFKGPQPPRIYRITPVFEKVQMFPVRTLARLPAWMRGVVYATACILWVVLFAVILTEFSMPVEFLRLGAPVGLSCVASLWPGPQSCGLDGNGCLPFDNSTFAFHCPAGCAGVRVLNPRAIGNVSINYRSLVVGGQAEGTEGVERAYRGDSFICGAAIHAGVISNNAGGCGVVSLAGSKRSFQSENRNGIDSVGFGSSFPLSFDFIQSDDIAAASKECRDPRWNLLALSTVFTALFGIFTSSAATFFAPIFTIMFFQIGMASDPPSYTTYASLASTVLGRFLPAALVAALFYQFSVRKTLRNCKAHVEKTILWVGGAWVGALGNYTFDKIPISRLTGHDIRQQPGAITALVIIVLVLFGIILYQAWCLRNEGRLPRYLALYATFGLGLGILSAMPGLTLRIHHYILALLLLPGTALQTRLSLLYQGLLVGLFINGVARWNFDSILQTAAQLRGDAQLGSVIPSILEPIVSNSSIAFSWNAIARGYDGVSVLVNDVERFRGDTNDVQFVWNRTEPWEDQFFRFGFVSHRTFAGVGFSDYTAAGVWDRAGAWSGIPRGRTGI